MVKRKIRKSSLIALVIVGFIGYITFNAWSMDNTPYKTISVDQFEKLMGQKDFTLINVHIPYQGEIEDTDILIPFNAMNQNIKNLPQNKDARIVVYCMGDYMSYIAAEQLTKMGYTSVFRLKGGMQAWQQKGRQLKHR